MAAQWNMKVFVVLEGKIILAFQRQGYGSAADEIILAYATKSGYKSASAQVGIDNEGSAVYL